VTQGSEHPPVGAEPPKRTWVEQIMGIPVSITVRWPDGVVAAAVANLFDRLRAVDAVFSLWRPDTQLSRLRRGEMAVADCDPVVAEVLDLCAQAHERTEGWFDAFLPDSGGVRRLDPTGLVKGWAVDRAHRAFVAAWAGDSCVNAGGDIALRCSRADSPPWLVGIEDPAERTRMLAAVALRQGGVATSGTSARGAHIVDPFSGRPPTGLSSVTVYGPSPMWADVYATAAFARGAGATAWLDTLDGYGWAVIDDTGTLTSGGQADVG
jgi:FAD:protein FMN transferase